MKDKPLIEKRYKRNISGNDEFVYRDKDVAKAVAELKDKVKDYFLYDEFKVDRVYILGIIDKIFGTFNHSPTEIGSQPNRGESPKEEDTSNSKVKFEKESDYIKQHQKEAFGDTSNSKGCGELIYEDDDIKCGDKTEYRTILCPKCQ